MTLSRTSDEYSQGVEEFVAAAIKFKNDTGSHIRCPCCDCNNMRFPSTISELKNHLIRRGFVNGYTRWTWHGEEYDFGLGSTNSENTENTIESGEDDDRFDEMFADHDMEENLNERPGNFDSVVRASQTELFSGCDKYTVLSAVLKLLNIKTRHNATDEIFSELFETIADMLPDGNGLPTSTYRAKKLVCPMGLDYKKIHACPRDCVLYRKEYAEMENCPRCGLSRYKIKDASSKKKGVPVKVLWYLPVIPRFRRLFLNEKNANLLRWHSEGRKRDGLMRHPADSPQWRNIDTLFPEFGKDSRNLRLALSTDGMNPYGSLSSRYSTWPVILAIYNLPPWLCMKRKYLMLSLLISGPKQPGNDIDVYLAPLIEDLKLLWDEGVPVFDSVSKSNFNLRAMIFCTINDFPAYGNLSGYPVKGRKACPICEDDTDAIRLEHSKKHVYLNHRRFLPVNHPYRKKKKAFGSVEMRKARAPLRGKEVYNIVRDITTEYGKPYKAAAATGYKKKSIFWDLPYWSFLEVRHCLDAMHIEKNVCDAIVGTLLNIPGKTKDGLNARKDMAALGHTELAPVEVGKRMYLPPACYTLSTAEKKNFCQSLYDLKVPSGYCSNFRSIVSLPDLKLMGMKSHDCHVLLQQFLPVCIRGILPVQVRHCINKLCQFFHIISSKVIDPVLLDEVQTDVVQTLCCLELCFPPSFFDIMPHLTVHLVREIKCCGPIFLRYMYPFERMMGILKRMVKNMARPEASIVQRSVCEEVISWCSEYVENSIEIGLPASRHYDRLQGKGTLGGRNFSMCPKLLRRAELYVLQNLADVHPYVEEHISVLRSENPTASEVDLNHLHDANFVEWFKTRVMLDLVNNPNLCPRLRWLAYGCDKIVRSYEGYDINGYTFYTKRQDNASTVQNSGVSVVALSPEYTSKRKRTLVEMRKEFYGFIDSIVELNYTNQFKVALFQCQWVDSTIGIQHENEFMKRVNLNKLGHHDDPFILASQAKQIFYMADPVDTRFSFVLDGKRHIVGIDNVVDEEEYDGQFHEMPSSLFNIPRIDIVRDVSVIRTRQDHKEGYFV